MFCIKRNTLIEVLLRKAATTQDDQERVRILHELASHPEETLERLIPILQSPDSSLASVAVQIIKEIGFPRNASAIPVLLTHTDHEHSPLHHEVFQTLIAMGPSMLPYIIQIAKEDDEIGVLVDSSFSQAKNFVAQTQVETQLVRTLAKYPDESLPAVLYILHNPLKDLWEVAVQVIQAMGYPNNALAIPLLVAHASMGNDIAENDALQALLALGPGIVVPYLLDALYDEGRTSTYMWISTSDLCLLLLHQQLDTTYVAPCGPMITYFLTHASNKQKDDAKLLLRVLEKIGPGCASYALPTLLHIALREMNAEDVQQAQHLIESFNKESLEPYKMLLSDMKIPLGE